MTEPATDNTARVYADVRDFPIFISHIDENTRLWLSPWRVWDFSAFLLGAGATLWAAWHQFQSGSSGAGTILVFGGALTALMTYLARQIPIGRPSPLVRLLWLAQCLTGTQHRAAAHGQRDAWLSPPKAVEGNIVFTRGGVYAEYIVAGQPGGMLPYDTKRAVAKGHRPLVRQLPSGMTFWGVSAPVDPMRLMKRMLHGREHQRRWVREVRDWENYLTIEPFYEPIFGVRVPIDSGRGGRASIGAAARAANVVVGRDHDAPETLDALREVADDVLATFPAEFKARPATPAEVRWLYHRHWTRGASQFPWPHDVEGPPRLCAEDFGDMPAHFDEGDQQARRRLSSPLRRRLPSMKGLLRIATDRTADSYQAMLAVAEMPRGGLAFPRAEFLLSAYDVPTNADIDWFQHVSVRPREQALQRVDRAQRNLNDQSYQRAGRRASDADLAQRFASAEDYNAELHSSSLESETESTTVIAVGSASAGDTLHAVASLQTHFGEELEIALASPRGAQTALWQLGHPGSESRAPRREFCQPTTTRQWARFAPLVSSELGHDTGILLGRNMATLRPTPVLIDLEGTTDRRGAPGLLLIGPPGGGKSECAKRIVDGLIKRGHQASIVDPGTMREWEPALAHHGDRVAAIDPAGGRWSLDGLRIFPREVAAEYTLDNLLPMMGVEATSALARQLRRLLRPDQRVAESMGGLLRWLNGLPRPESAEYAELADTLSYWADMDYLRAMFDESLPVPPIAEKDAVIWLTSSLELPDTGETEQLHLYRQQSARARAGLGIYGMIAALTRLTYTGPGRRPNAFGWFVAEEARSYFASAAGRKDALRIATQGRKEKYGLIGISQHAEDFDAIGAQDLPMRVITPFKPTDRDYARASFRKLGINPDEYPEVLNTRTVDGHGYAYFIDDFGRAGLVDLLHPVQDDLVAAFDTRNLNNSGVRR